MDKRRGRGFGGGGRPGLRARRLRAQQAHLGHGAGRRAPADHGDPAGYGDRGLVGERLGQAAGAAGARLARRPGEDRRGRAAAPQAAEDVQAVAHGGGRGVVERPRQPAGADHPSAGRVVGPDVARRGAGRVLAAGEQQLAAQRGHGGVAQAARQLRRQVGRPAAGVAVDRCVGGGAVPAADHVDGAADRHRAVVGERLGQAADAARRAGGDAHDRVGAFGLAAAEQHGRAPARRRRPVVDRLREARQRARAPAGGREGADRGRRGVGRGESAGRIDRAAHPRDCRILDRRGQRGQRAGARAQRRRRDRAARRAGARLASAGAFPVASVVCAPLPPQPTAAHAAPAIAASEANVETAERGALPTPASWPTQALRGLRER